jgi:hypothetical protein
MASTNYGIVRNPYSLQCHAPVAATAPVAAVAAGLPGHRRDLRRSIRISGADRAGGAEGDVRHVSEHGAAPHFIDGPPGPIGATVRRGLVYPIAGPDPRDPNSAPPPVSLVAGIRPIYMAWAGIYRRGSTTPRHPSSRTAER